MLTQYQETHKTKNSILCILTESILIAPLRAFPKISIVSNLSTIPKTNQLTMYNALHIVQYYVLYSEMWLRTKKVAHHAHAWSNSKRHFWISNDKVKLYIFFVLMVSNCPFDYDGRWCQIVQGVKLSWCQFVLFFIDCVKLLLWCQVVLGSQKYQYIVFSYPVAQETLIIAFC